MFFAVTSEDKVPIAVARFTNEVSRLLGVMEKRLAQVPFLAGDDYSIADIAAYPWVLAASASLNNDDLATSTYRVPALRRWQEAVAVRPAVARGMHIPPA
jgi:GST-like protein